MRVRKTALMQQVEERMGRPLEVVLRDLFEQGLTDDEVSEHLGISRTSLYIWLFRLGGRVEKAYKVSFPDETISVP